MAKEKKYKLAAEDIHELVIGHGACMATDRITVDGEPVDYMYREEPMNNVDSGWRFFSGTEDQEYVDDPDNSAFYNMNTIANYDKAIIPYLDLPVGSQLERVRGSEVFNLIPG